VALAKGDVNAKKSPKKRSELQRRNILKDLVAESSLRPINISLLICMFVWSTGVTCDDDRNHQL
jgi:hypothetical protein